MGEAEGGVVDKLLFRETCCNLRSSQRRPPPPHPTHPSSHYPLSQFRHTQSPIRVLNQICKKNRQDHNFFVFITVFFTKKNGHMSSFPIWKIKSVIFNLFLAFSLICRHMGGASQNHERIPPQKTQKIWYFTRQMTVGRFHGQLRWNFGGKNLDKCTYGLISWIKKGHWSASDGLTIENDQL